MKAPHTILLDLDNTVYRYAPCHDSGMADATKAAVASGWKGGAERFEAAYDEARNRVKQRVGKLAASHCRLLYFKELLETETGRTDISRALSLHDAYWRGYFSRLCPDPGCAEFLRAAAAVGTKLAWVTNFTTERQMGKLQAMRLDAVTDILVTSEEAGAEKPAEPPFRIALEKLGTGARGAWMIGDDLEADLVPAKSLGMTTIWLGGPAKAPRHGAVDLVAATWNEIAAFFASTTSARSA